MDTNPSGPVKQLSFMYFICTFSYLTWVQSKLVMASRDELNIPTFILTQVWQTLPKFGSWIRTPLKSMGAEYKNSVVDIFWANRQENVKKEAMRIRQWSGGQVPIKKIHIIQQGEDLFRWFKEQHWKYKKPLNYILRGCINSVQRTFSGTASVILPYYSLAYT